MANIEQKITEQHDHLFTAQVLMDRAAEDFVNADVDDAQRCVAAASRAIEAAMRIADELIEAKI